MKNNRNILKKSFLMIMAIVMVFSLFACGSKPNANETADTSEINETEETEIVAENEQSEETAPTDVDTDDCDVDPNLMDEDGEAPHNNDATIPDSDEWYFTEDTNKTPTSSSASSTHSYVGRFKIPSVGVDVACYASNSQATTDAWDSAAYYYGNGHQIIADHVNQGFSAIKSCKEGAMATLETATGTQTYTCIAKINGHNTGTLLTDENGNQIRDMYPGALVAYTCNGNWRNITIVFFGVPGVDYSEPDVDNNESNANNGNNNSNNDTSNDNNNSNETTEPTNKCEHSWGWWIVGDEGIDENGYYYGWDVRTCDLCQCEERVVRHTPSFSLSQKLEEERKAKEEAESNTTEPSKSVESSENVETEVGDAGIGGESSDVGNYGDTVIPDVNPAGDSTSTGET